MSDFASRASWGCVIGRFQPFHQDHFTLVTEAYQHHGRVIVAITNADPTWQVSVREAPHRHLPASNPFTYWQRHEMICAALKGIVPADALRIVPFPMHDQSLWPFYLPGDVECWVRNRGAWEERKIEELRSRFVVRVVSAVPGEVSGTEVRRRLASSGHSQTHEAVHEATPEATREATREATDADMLWRALVPGPVADCIERWLLDGSWPVATLASRSSSTRSS